MPVAEIIDLTTDTAAEPVQPERKRARIVAVSTQQRLFPFIICSECYSVPPERTFHYCRACDNNYTLWDELCAKFAQAELHRTLTLGS